MKETPKLDLSALAARWPSAIVAREKVAEFSGGILNPKTLANLAALHQGPGMIKIGRKVAYRTKDLVDWMCKRAK